MRAMWTGAISFGLVNVPVKLYSATENHDLSFRQVRASDGSRIKLKRVAEADGAEVAWAELAKGYEAEDGRMVILSDEDLASLPNKSSKEISVEKFVPREQVDPLLFDRAYYVEPTKAGAKPYALLREVLAETDRVALVTVSVRQRMSTALLRVHDDAIVLQTLLWPDEIRDVGKLENLDGAADPKPAEVAMAKMLVESMAGDFDPDEFEDDYTVAVQRLVEAKLEGGEAADIPAAAPADQGKVVDLLAALQKSVDAAAARRAAATATGDADGSDAAEGGASEDAEPAEAAAPKRTRRTKAAPKPAEESEAADEAPKRRTRKAG